MKTFTDLEKKISYFKKINSYQESLYPTPETSHSTSFARRISEGLYSSHSFYFYFFQEEFPISSLMAECTTSSLTFVECCKTRRSGRWC